MKRSAKWIGCLASAALFVATSASFLAQQTATASVKDEVALRAAMEKETVQGDLKGAIEQYKKLAQSKDRSVAAKALVRMAESYQKLGDTQARAVFQQVVKDYSDQAAAAAEARAYLGGGPTATVLRKVWDGQKVVPEGHVSGDGRYISYPAWDTGDLGLHDLNTKTDRLLTKSDKYANGFAEGSAFSRDGKQLAYAWFNNKRYELRVIPVSASSITQSRQVFDNPEVDWLAPYDWSPDGKWIATFVQYKNHRSQLALIGVSDGSLRVLKPAGYVGPVGMYFSPDGAYLAYDMPADQTSPQRDVYITTADGGREIPVVVHDANEVVVGWSPDGSKLLFTSDRTGSVGLWALPVANGKPQGAVELLKPDVGEADSLGLTDSGALYLYKRINTRDVTVAGVDLAVGRLTTVPAPFPRGFEDPMYPQWSRDGRYLAYPACNNRCIAIRSVATGQARQLPSKLLTVHTPNWSPDGRSLLAVGRDVDGRDGIFKIDVDSGDVATVKLGVGLNAVVQWSPDAKKVYFESGESVVERDLSSGTERDVYRGPISGGVLSPDGRYFAVRTNDASAKTTRILLVPVAGGQSRELLHLAQPEGLGWGSGVVGVWTADSAAIIVDKITGSRRELWLVPLDAGQPRKLDIDPNIWLRDSSKTGEQGFSISPDGRQLAFQMGKTVAEIWALENFLPPPKASK